MQQQAEQAEEVECLEERMQVHDNPMEVQVAHLEHFEATEDQASQEVQHARLEQLVASLPPPKDEELAHPERLEEVCRSQGQLQTQEAHWVVR